MHDPFPARPPRRRPATFCSPSCQSRPRASSRLRLGTRCPGGQVPGHLRGRAPDKGNEAYPAEPLLDHTGLAAPQAQQVLVAPGPADRQDQDAARRQLVDQLARYLRGSRGDDDALERRLGGPALGAVPGARAW